MKKEKVQKTQPKEKRPVDVFTPSFSGKMVRRRLYNLKSSTLHLGVHFFIILMHFFFTVFSFYLLRIYFFRKLLSLFAALALPYRVILLFKQTSSQCDFAISYVYVCSPLRHNKNPYTAKYGNYVCTLQLFVQIEILKVQFSLLLVYFFSVTFFLGCCCFISSLYPRTIALHKCFA